MGASKELFLRMSAEDYFNIPQNILDSHLKDKVYRESLDDYSELIKDPIYKGLVDAKKKVNKDLEHRKEELRNLNKKL